MKVQRSEAGGMPVVVKVATTPAEGDHLVREREWLRRAAHPGVVCAVAARTSVAEVGAAAGADALVTRAAGATDLSRLGALPAPELCGFGAAAATTLADLHDLGVGHHGIRDSHLIVADDGAPVLCSFGRAGPIPDGGRADVRDLADALLAHLDQAAAGGVRRVLRRAASDRRTVAARDLARDLARAVRSPRLPAGRAEAATSVSRRDLAVEPLEEAETPARTARPGLRTFPAPAWALRHRRLLAGAVACAIAIAVGATVMHGPAGSTPPRPAATAAAGGSTARSGSAGHSCPDADAGCQPVSVHSGVFRAEGRQWRLSARSPVVVVGRWTCAGPLPAVLDRTTGEIWVFAAWPDRGRRETARPVGRVVGATTLAVVGGRAGCDRIRVTARGGRTTVLSATLGSGS